MGVEIIRDVVFVSHANPEDNDLAVWLTLQLTNLGYRVWCDQVKFKGGEDFWGQAEDVIRNYTIRFLFITTTNSQAKEGTLKELAVADKVRKDLKIPDFVIPLHADPALSFSNFKTEIIRQVAISFASNWADGLKALVEKLEKENIPKNPEINFSYVAQWWKNQQLAQQSVINAPEKYTSNWLPIRSFPEKLFFHDFRIEKYWQADSRHCACRLFKNHLVTFADHDEFEKEDIYPKGYDPSKTRAVDVKSILDKTLESDFISAEEAMWLLINILNKAWEKTFLEKGLIYYEISRRRKVLFPTKGLFTKDKIHFKTDLGKASWRAYVGTKTVWPDKEYYWHYGISCSSQFEPVPSFVITSHIVFTSDGKKIIYDTEKQHALRRKVGKDWWNNDWRDRLVNFIRSYVNDNGELLIHLSRKKDLICASNCAEMESPVAYKDPAVKEILLNVPEEALAEEVVLSEQGNE